jgi:outer membrane protein assembly factor BamB
MNKLARSLIFLMLVSVAAMADDWPQWRGAKRDGISTEQGLLKAWPEGGPVRLWLADVEGDGYGSPVIVGEVLYLTVAKEEGKDRTGYLQAIAVADGKRLWETAYGPEWSGQYPGVRCTPTVTKDRIFVISGVGGVACFDLTGKILWKVNTLTEFGGRNIGWGIAESPLVYEGLVICHPGGKGTAVVALDAMTGKVRWQTTTLDDASAYCSPIVAKMGGRNVLLTQTAMNVVGIDVGTGAVLWKHGHSNACKVHPNIPLQFAENRVYVASGYGYGGESLEIQGGEVKRLWLDKRYENHFQGMVLKGGRIYTCSGKGLQVVNPNDGSLHYESREVGKAQITMTEAGLLAYSGNGTVLLVRMDDAACEVVGKFRVEYGTNQHWATPIIANGRLYIRHGGALAAYDVREKK